MSFDDGQGPVSEHVPASDQRIFMRMSWSQYEALEQTREEKRFPRITYLDGVVELMSPADEHERIAWTLGRLIEAYADEEGIDYTPYGSWTLKAEGANAGVEADACYIVGLDQSGAVPDVAIEIVWTHGGLKKLEAYRRLEVREVWFWKKSEIAIFVLRDGEYVRTDASVAFPGIDLALLCRFLEQPVLSQAVKAYRAALRSR